MPATWTARPENFKYCAGLVLTSVVYTWLNLRTWGSGYGGSRGFPFAYETWKHVAPSFAFHEQAALGNLVIGIILAVACIIAVARIVPWTASTFLVILSAIYIWLNLGWPAESYGFPLSHLVSGEESLIRNLCLLVAGLTLHGVVAGLCLVAITSARWTAKWCCFVGAFFLSSFVFHAYWR